MQNTDFDHEDEDNVEGPSEPMISMSEHYQLTNRERTENNNRQFAIEQARLAHPVTSAANLVSEARKIEEYLSGEPSEPVGLIANADGSLLNWKGENYVRQSAASDYYRTGAEDRQRLVLRRVRELLKKKAESYTPDTPTTVGYAFNSFLQIIDNANWEF